MPHSLKCIPMFQEALREIVDKTDSPFAMPYENGRPIFICRNSRLSLEKLWDRLKRYR